MTSQTTADQSPLDLFNKAIAAGIEPTVHDCWINFSCWEMARQFVDDPSHPAKAAIEWVYALEDLRAGLDEFEGDARQECVNALDRACEAFAKLQHSAELKHGIEAWIEYCENP